jgi:hypothetical protein
VIGSDDPFRSPAALPARRLRPLPVSALLEIAARVLRRHWPVLVGLAVLFGLPAALLSSASGMPLGTTLSRLLPASAADTAAPLVLTNQDLSDLGTGLLIAVAGSLAAGVLAAIAAVGFARVVARDYHGDRVTLGDAATRSLVLAVAAVGAALVAAGATLALVTLGLAAVVGIVAVTAGGDVTAGGPGAFLALVVVVAVVAAVALVNIRWALATPVIATEGSGPVAALRRSWHLTAAHAWRTFLVMLLTALVVGVLGMLVAQVLAIVFVDPWADAAGHAVLGEAAVSTVVSVLFAPVGPVVLTVLYFDQRVRRDGWDLPAPVAAGFAGPDDAQRPGQR